MAPDSVSTVVPAPTAIPPALPPTTTTPSVVAAPDLRSPTSDLRSTVRQISALVRTADAAVRATPAGSQAWARVEETQAAYEAALRLDENYRNLLAQQARLEATGPTNAMDDPIAVGNALGARESVLMRERTEVAHARAACEQARREYGRLAREDPRFADAVRTMGTMETNGVTPKTP